MTPECTRKSVAVFARPTAYSPMTLFAVVLVDETVATVSAPAFSDTRRSDVATLQFIPYALRSARRRESCYSLCP